MERQEFSIFLSSKEEEEIRLIERADGKAAKYGVIGVLTPHVRGFSQCLVRAAQRECPECADNFRQAFVGEVLINSLVHGGDRHFIVVLDGKQVDYWSKSQETHYDDLLPWLAWAWCRANKKLIPGTPPAHSQGIFLLLSLVRRVEFRRDGHIVALLREDDASHSRELRLEDLPGDRGCVFYDPLWKIRAQLGTVGRFDTALVVA